MGRVPGCFGLGALFLCGWEGRTDRLPAGRLHGRAWCGRFAGSLSVLVFGGVRCGGLPGGGGPSALRWMAAGAEFPCGVLGGCGLSALRWMVAGAEFPCGVPGGDGHRRCGGCVVGGVWHRRCGGCSGMRFWRFLSKGFC